MRAAIKWGVGIVATASIASTTSASSWVGIEPFVGRAAFEQLLSELDVPDDDRVVASVLYDDYLEAMSTARAERRERRRRAGGDRLEAALSGAAFLEADELKTLRRAVHAVVPAAWPAFDQAADELIASAASLSRSAPPAAALHSVRRAMWLQPRRASEGTADYAGEGLDVVVLAEAARRDGGPLATVPAETIAPHLDRYTVRIDAFLGETAAADRHDRWALVDARLAGDDDRRQAIAGQLVTRWSRAYAIHRETVVALADVVRARKGDAAADAWRDRFDHACFPTVFRPDETTRRIEWMRRQVEDQAIRAQVDAIAVEHAARRRELCRAAIGLLVEARLQHRYALTLETTPAEIDDRAVRDVHLALLRNSGSLAALDRDMAAQLGRLLDEKTRRRMTRALRPAS